jgi:hypothetical protein
VQQERQRIVGGMASREMRVRARGAGIAVADGQQSMGNGVAAAGMTPLAAGAANPFGRAPQPAQDRPREDRGYYNDAQRQREYRQRGVDPPAAPRQRHVAALLGNPRRARRRKPDQCEKQNDTVHRNPTGPVW